MCEAVAVLSSNTLESAVAKYFLRGTTRGWLVSALWRPFGCQQRPVVLGDLPEIVEKVCVRRRRSCGVHRGRSRRGCSHEAVAGAD
jgi:hypothetical protein